MVPRRSPTSFLGEGAAATPFSLTRPFRRGRKFGTIIVDLQTHKMLDVLPGRTAETTAAWMAAHPEIELVSRDRGGDYASATATGAPQAVQCADRFHMLKNLGEVVEGVLARHLAAKRKIQTQTALEEHRAIEEVSRSVRRSRDQSSIF